jgi:competence protein ComFC
LFKAWGAVGTYGGMLQQAIHLLKYGCHRILADPLADLLHQYLVAGADFPWRRATCIVPVPIHAARKRTRGYNQSELLAHRLSVLTGLAVSDALERTIFVRPQVELSEDERRLNVKNAFRVTRPAEIKGGTILLLDDVSTTCSTVHECSLSLLRAGAARIYVLCLAFDA